MTLLPLPCYNIFRGRYTGAVSSAGEHLPYKQGVGSSNLPLPTIRGAVV
ncbi:MAG: hypothetical protein PWP70_409 [Moorella sp. (in: firmicutes)]|nr:hypothetical protein [Moorella sp. (in: firmicutes)]